MAQPRRILVAIDGSESSNNALNWAVQNVCKASDELHLVTVLPPMTYSVYPVAPVATAAAVAAVTHQWEAQKRHDEKHATEILKCAVEMCLEQGVRRCRNVSMSAPTLSDTV